MNNTAMNHSAQYQEYSARYGLKSSQNNIEIAQQIAEAKYRALVRRDIAFSEMVDIRHFIEELQSWSLIAKQLPKASLTH